MPFGYMCGLEKDFEAAGTFVDSRMRVLKEDMKRINV